MEVHNGPQDEALQKEYVVIPCTVTMVVSDQRNSQYRKDNRTKQDLHTGYLILSLDLAEQLRGTQFFILTYSL